MQTPQFSIIIPVYNAQNFIKDALSSCVEQSFDDIEIIIIDDKSTDESVNFIKEFMAKDDRIKLICNDTNLGTFATRNKGALKANGQYLLFLDADDKLDLQACEKIEKELKRYKQEGQIIEILGFNYGEQLHLLHKKRHLFSIQDFVLYAYKNGIGKYWTLWGKAFLKTIFVKSLQNLDLTQRLLIAEDALNFINVLFYAQNYACISDRLYIYHENENSITRREDEEKLKTSIENHYAVVHKLLDLSSHFSAFEQCFTQIFCIDLQISALNDKRKLKPSFFNYLITSFQKKILRIRQRHYVSKILSFNESSK